MKLTIRHSPRKALAGLGLMVLQLAVFPSVLQLMNRQLGEPMSRAEVNALLHLLNLISALTLLGPFLLQNVKQGFARPGRLFGSVGTGLGIYFGGSYLVTLVVLSLQPEFTNINTETVIGMSRQHFPLWLVLSVLVVPITEELLFRGVLFCTLQTKSRVLAYGVSATVFALLHLKGYLGLAAPVDLLLSFFQYVPAGIAFAWTYERSDSLAAPILTHMLINLISMLIPR